MCTNVISLSFEDPHIELGAKERRTENCTLEGSFSIANANIDAKKIVFCT